jgi:hypothetical protein
MATYVNNLRLKEIATGDESGTWGTSTNTNLELIGEALGFGTEAITTNADTHTTTVADGSSDAGRAMYLKYTGTLDSACTITIGPNTMKRMQFIENGTSGSQNIIISQGSGANVTIPPGDVKAVYLDGAGSGAAVTDAFASLNVVDLKVEDDLTVTDDLIVNGDIDLEGSIDVNGTANLDVVDIDGAVDMASTLQVDGAITSSAGATITTADNTDTLSLISTDADANTGPNLRLYRNSGSPADDDVTGVVTFTGRNDNSEDVIYSRQLSYIKDASDGTEDGQTTLQTMVAGTIRDRLNITPSEVVLNEDSIDTDFRVESGSNTNMLFVDGGNDRVGIGTDSPANTLHVTGSGSTPFATQRDVNSGGFAMIQGKMGDSASTTAGHAYSALVAGIEDNTNGAEDGYFAVEVSEGGSSSEKLRIQSNGSVGIGTTSVTNALGWASIAQIGGANPALSLRNSSSVQWDISNFGGTFNIYNGSDARLKIDSSGNVGIGQTSSLDARLNVTVDSGNEGIQVYRAFGGNGGGYQGVSFAMGNSASASNVHVYSSIVPNIISNTDGSEDGSIAFYTSKSGTNAEKVRIDEDGNVGIGTTSPDSLVDIEDVHSQLRLTDSDDSKFVLFSYSGGKLVVRNNSTSTTANQFTITEDGDFGLGTISPAFTNGSGLEIERDGIATLRLTDTGSSGKVFEIYVDDATGNHIGGLSSGLPMIFSVINSERMRIDTSGNLIVGGTSVNAEGSFTIRPNTSQGSCLVQINRNDTASTSNAFVFYNEGSGVGSITYTNSATAYNTSSDARLKDVTGEARGLEIINALNPVAYNWKNSGKADEGLIAQEVMEIVPKAVSKTPDDMYQMDYSKLVTPLIKAIQEQQEQIEQLKVEIQTLKGE